MPKRASDFARIKCEIKQARNQPLTRPDENRGYVENMTGANSRAITRANKFLPIELPVATMFISEGHMLLGSLVSPNLFNTLIFVSVENASGRKLLRRRHYYCGWRGAGLACWPLWLNCIANYFFGTQTFDRRTRPWDVLDLIRFTAQGDRSGQGKAFVQRLSYVPFHRLVGL